MRGNINAIITASIDTIAELTCKDKELTYITYATYFDRLIEKDIRIGSNEMLHDINKYQIKALKLTARYMRRYYGNAIKEL
jgi:hypothetical protein